jgi:prolyl-tRNA editing enzyme YbaK/EbsC (Cys-tRNA(Pro) deacylase)
MPDPLSPSAQKVQNALQTLGLSLQVVELPASTRTAVDAAQAVGCQVGQIVKSLIFKTKRSQRPILVVASGANRVDEKKIATLTGEPLGKADADFVRQQTGFVIGGVPPVGHTQPLDTYIDAELLQYDEIWAAAGTPNAVFRLAPNDLARMTGGLVTDIKQD